MKIWLVEQESEVEWMEQRMELKDVWEFYGRNEIVQSGEWFEIRDKLQGFTTVVPCKFYRFMDGSLIDPATMLIDRMGWMRRELLRGLNLCAPVMLLYAFGRFAVVNGEKKFYVQDSMEATAGSMDLLVEADWDLRQGVSDIGWISEVEQNWGGNIRHQRTIPGDIYETFGRQIWILHMTTSMMEMMKLKTDFYTWQRQAIERSDEVLRKFEAEKGSFQKRMRECLKKLPGRVHWIVVAKEEELWPKYDANQELWTKYEYDWQIMQFEDHLEIRTRGGSPGAIEAKYPRYDAVGLQMCQILLK